MRAFVISGPGQGEVREVEPPRAEPGLVVVEVDRVGLCGTDEELFSGGMSYLETAEAAYPVRPGHEWAGRVVEIGEGVDASWMDARVTGDTMLGDGTCHLCRSGRQHLCAEPLRDRAPARLAGRPRRAAARPGARAAPPPRRGGPAARGARRTQRQRRPGPASRRRAIRGAAPRVRPRHDRLARRLVRPGGRRRGPPGRPERAVASVRDVARVRARLDRRHDPRPPLRRGRGRLQRAAAAGPRDRARGPRPARLPDRHRGRAQPGRHSGDHLSRADRGRCPQRVRRPGRGDRAPRVRNAGPAPARCRNRWPRRGCRRCSAGRRDPAWGPGPKIHVDPRR